MAEFERYRYNKSVYVAAIGKCGACYICVDECPEGAIEKSEPVKVDYNRCTRCMKCVEVCPGGIMQIID